MTIQEIIDNAKIQAVIDQLQDMDDNEKLSIYNECVLDNNDPDAEIFLNDEDFFQMCFDSKDLMGLLNRAYYGDYNPNYTYVHFDRLGNLESSDYWEDLADWDEDAIAEYLIENEHYTIAWDEVQEAVDEAVEVAMIDITTITKHPDFDDLAGLIEFAMDNTELDEEDVLSEYLEYIKE